MVYKILFQVIAVADVPKETQKTLPAPGTQHTCIHEVISK